MLLEVDPRFRGALHFVASKLAASVRPAPPVLLSKWLSENLVLVDGPEAGELWSADGAPYLAEIADCLSDDHPCNEVSIRKSQQSGASILALGWCLYIADREPGNTLYAIPGIDALKELNSGKLQPLIDAWEKKTDRKVIFPQTSRSASGSKTNEKVFSGGRLWLANANSIMDLSSKTAKKGVKDEVSKWETLDNGADPETLYFGRFTAFRRKRTFKILAISTPEVDVGDGEEEVEGHCRIDRAFKRSDQRFWNCVCPNCKGLFVHHFERFNINAAQPHLSTYPCIHCKHEITDAERVGAIRAGRWVASVDEPGRHPGFHIDAFISLMMSYQAIAEDELNSPKTEKAKKDFSNLVLGLPYRFRGDAPDHEKLMARREEFTRGHVPRGALLLTVGCDVQMRGIYYVVKAHAPNRESWIVDADYLDGKTTRVDEGAFLELTKLFERKWPDAWGNSWRHDEFAIDANYRTNAVYEWTRRHAGTKAVQGRDGWARPALGIATEQDIDYRGKKMKGGAKLRGVGTWPLKSTFYANLGLLPELRGGVTVYPDGYCHHATWLDEIYFKQITSEYLGKQGDGTKQKRGAKQKRGGRERQIWIQRGAAGNHFLDCNIYADAVAEAYLTSFTPDDWMLRARERGIGDLQAELFTPDGAPIAPREASPRPIAQRGLYGDDLAKLNKEVW
jgi:phage terminase large subunit GpA-like protein